MRTVALVLTGVALTAELLWLLFLHGSIGWITAIAVGCVAVQFGTAARVRAITVVVRVVLGLLLLGSVADRFGFLGAPGDSGVSWGSFDAFTDYTASLLPSFLETLATPAAVTATVAETVLGLALIVGFATRATASATAVLLATFGLAMLTSVGFDAMSGYAVAVLAAGAFSTATAAPPVRRPVGYPAPA
ncbi:DoxX family membrane protein [Nocardia sp. NPDC050712]|uniref:DoxX family membrane protein n=1 Tax=Nocardia sp. NPDC050712 TaxID=3155518 RepID=UPI0033D30C43